MKNDYCYDNESLYYVYHMLYSTVYGTKCRCQQLLPATSVTRPEPNTHPLSGLLYNFTYRSTMWHHIHNVHKTCAGLIHYCKHYKSCGYNNPKHVINIFISPFTDTEKHISITKHFVYNTTSFSWPSFTTIQMVHYRNIMYLLEE